MPRSYHHFFLMIAKRQEQLQLFFVTPVESVLIQICCCKCRSCLVQQRGIQHALNVSVCLSGSSFTCNVILLICSGNKAVHFQWLHRNNVYNITALEQLSKIVVPSTHVTQVLEEHLLLSALIGQATTHIQVMTRC